jgi:predicted PurR-regulated permease PerM
VVRRVWVPPDGTRRLPRGLSIIICYIIFLAALAGFMMVLVPRLSKDVSRIGAELPELYDKLNEEWAPDAARWLERRFPSLAPDPIMPTEAPIVADVPLPPGTSFVITPLPDGRMAVQLSPAGLDIAGRAGGGFTITAREESPAEMSTEERIRYWANNALGSLQSQLGDAFRFGQALLGAMVGGIFTFFLTLMVAAFILLDLDKIHDFVRSLIPQAYRQDYDVIVAGMDRGLSGVIRGQLLICLVNGMLTYVGLVIFDVKYSIILAVVAAVLSLIPIFGSILSTIPIVMAALVSGTEGVDLARPVFITAWIVGIHFIEANFLNPKIIGTAAKIHPVLVIFALIIGEHSYGLVGALLAVPAASMIQVLFLFFRRKAWKPEGREPTVGPGQAPPGV